MASSELQYCTMVVLLMLSCASLSGSSAKELPPAAFIFGDSLVDAGNNNYLKTIVKSNFHPYGLNFEGHVPTGRFTDGLLVTDYICKHLSITF